MFNIVSFSYISHVNIWFGSHRLGVGRQSRREARSSRTRRSHSPVKGISPLIEPNSRLPLQQRHRLRTWTRQKLQWMSRKRKILLHIPSLIPSPCGSPFPLYCLSWSPTGAVPLRPRTRAARLRSHSSRRLPAATVIAQVGKVVFLLHFLTPR